MNPLASIFWIAIAVVSGLALGATIRSKLPRDLKILLGAGILFATGLVVYIIALLFEIHQ